MTDIYTIGAVNRAIQEAPPPSNFLLDTFFPVTQESQTEEIHFDIDKSKPRLAPFVSPLVAGKVIEQEGMTTHTFKPAYVKDKTRLDPMSPIKRALGEKIGGSMTPMERRILQLASAINRSLERLTRREIVMASEALRLGRVTVVGDNYPTRVVDFQRHGSNTKTLTLGARWGENGVDPLDNLETWAGEIRDRSGCAADTVIVDTKASKLLRASPQWEKMLNRDATRWKENLVDGPVVRGTGKNASTFLGRVGPLDVWEYNEPYVDDAGADAMVLPDYTCIIGARGQPGSGVNGAEGVRAYGMIMDEKANYQASRYFGKSWLEEDPAVRFLLAQSAPLVFTYRPNAVASATVR